MAPEAFGAPLTSTRRSQEQLGRSRPRQLGELLGLRKNDVMMAGATPAAVQRILRHSDPRITTELFRHLAPHYLPRAIDLLRFEKVGNDLLVAPARTKRTILW